MRLFLLLTSLLLAACDNGSVSTHSPQDTSVNPLTEIKAKLAFTCAHEQIPVPSAETDELFQYARWLQKNNLLKQDKSVDAEIERLYRIAAENGHYKAIINLQNGAMRGHFMLRSADHLRLSQQLIDAHVATGYYFVGLFLKNGSAGLKQDTAMALRYLRKAADQGSAQAQYEVAKNWRRLTSRRTLPGRCTAVPLNKAMAMQLLIWVSTLNTRAGTKRRSKFSRWALKQVVRALQAGWTMPSGARFPPIR